MSIAIIVGMAVATVGSGVAEKILTKLGKVDEAAYLNFATGSGIAATALSIFAKFLFTLNKLG